MSPVSPAELPARAAPSLEIIRVLAAAGQQALLAGGCVRDLLLGMEPSDYDVVTDAVPERVRALFRATRFVGAQFGVVLVKVSGVWVEVATFRADGPYLDGRRPTHVSFGDARADAQRRDFTVNGMFLDPLATDEARRIIDYVGGRADLAARTLRAIGDPADRFAEDHLRLLRAVRFAARLGFTIEPATAEALRAAAPRLAGVAAERVREELERMLTHRHRVEAWRLLCAFGLLEHLWPGAAWDAAQRARVVVDLAALPVQAGFVAALAVLLADRDTGQADGAARALSLSNQQREALLWVLRHAADLDDPAGLRLAALKTCLHHGACGALRAVAATRFARMADGAARAALLAERISAIAPEAIAPAPLVGGRDLEQRHVPHGPIYREVLDDLYRRQLDEEFADRAGALRALEAALREREG